MNCQTMEGLFVDNIVLCITSVEETELPVKSSVMTLAYQWLAADIIIFLGSKFRSVQGEIF